MAKMGRPKKNAADVRQTHSATILPTVIDEIEAAAIAERRSKSAITEFLLLRGIAAYKRDGKLIEPVITMPASNSGGVKYNQIIDVRSLPPGVKAPRNTKTLEILDSPVDIDQGQPIRKKREKVG